MRVIYRNGNSKITIDAVSEISAAKSFEEIVRQLFPDKINVRWQREVEVDQAIQEFNTALTRTVSNDAKKGN